MREVLVKVYTYSELSGQSKQYTNSVWTKMDSMISKSNNPDVKEAHKKFDRTKAEYFVDGTLYLGDN